MRFPLLPVSMQEDCLHKPLCNLRIMQDQVIRPDFLLMEKRVLPPSMGRDSFKAQGSLLGFSLGRFGHARAKEENPGTLTLNLRSWAKITTNSLSSTSAVAFLDHDARDLVATEGPSIEGPGNYHFRRAPWEVALFWAPFLRYTRTFMLAKIELMT